MSENLTEVFAHSKDFQHVVEMTSRIDERVKTIIKKQEEMDRKVSDMMVVYNTLMARVTVLESRDSLKLEKGLDDNNIRINTLENQVDIIKIHQLDNGERWKNVFQMVLQITTTTAVGYLLWKLGLPSP